jgi:hypothetical protein
MLRKNDVGFVPVIFLSKNHCYLHQPRLTFRTIGLREFSKVELGDTYRSEPEKSCDERLVLSGESLHRESGEIKPGVQEKAERVFSLKKEKNNPPKHSPGTVIG